MNCHDFEEAMSSALAGETAEPAPGDAADHLRRCGACRSRASQALRIHETLYRSLSEDAASLEQQWRSILQGVERDLRSSGTDMVAAAREKIEKLSASGSRSAFRPGRRRAALVAAGILVTAAGLAAFLFRPKSETPSASTANPDLHPEKKTERPRPEERSEPRVPSEDRSVVRETPPAPDSGRREDPVRPKKSSDDEEKRKTGAPDPTAEARRPEKVEPAPPVPAPEAPRRAPDRTFAMVGRVERVLGAAYVTGPDVDARVKAREGQELASGQAIVTEGPGSGVWIAEEGVAKFRMGPDGRIDFGASAAKVTLAQGSLDIDVAREGRLVLETTHARVETAVGHFFLHAHPDSTYFESQRGSAQFINRITGNASPVTAGQFAVASPRGGVDQARIDRAIKDGIEFLKKAPSPPCPPATMTNSDPLVLLTFLHAGVPETDARFQEMLKELLKAPIERTYGAALQAMILEELDRVKYQARIADCAQFLVDNQCKTGQWTYGTPTPAANGAFVDPHPDVATASKVDPAGRRIKPKVVRKVAVQKTRDGPATGDNSNAQYAALGLRACFDAGVIVPNETIQTAARWWRESQYADKEDRKNGYGGKGWCYHDGKGRVNGSDCCKYTYAAMTAGAAGSLVIYDFMLGKDWKSDASVRLGMEWLTTNFSVTRDFKRGREVPADPDDQGAFFYYLYALERLGTFTAQEKFGRHEWYPEGATVILERQRADGSWMDLALENQPVWDTCFSILFLRRATRPLTDVPSVDRFQKR